MVKLNRILCPVDFSKPSRRALRQALAIARWHESELTVLHVEDVLLYAATVKARGYPELAERHYQELREFINGVGGRDRNVRIHIATGDAGSGILDYATREASDLIVMGTNGRSGLARVVLGSVTERVVRESPAPVLTIPASAEMREPEELMPFETLLCASDFSPACRRALDLAIVMGQEADARLILLHALPAAGSDSELRKDRLTRLKRGLPSDAVFRCRPEAVVAEGAPGEAILETAFGEDVDLIVMGIQARGAIDRLLFGSTTRRVMQSARCPVLSIRASRTAEPWPSWPGAVAAGPGISDRNVAFHLARRQSGRRS